MTEVERMLTLPLPTLVVLAAGYMGYRLAYVGRDATHGALDTAFLSLVFAALAQGIMTAAPLPSSGAMATALTATLGAALVWRRWGDGMVQKLLRRTGFSISDRHVTAWDSLRTNPDLRPTQIMVELKDGKTLMCDRLSDFDARPTNACRLGADGSVAMYVTDVFRPGSEDWEKCSPIDPAWGGLITYIPAGEIALLEVRY